MKFQSEDYWKPIYTDCWYNVYRYKKHNINWFNFDLRVYSVLSECLWKKFTGDSGGIWTHDLLRILVHTS